MGSLGNERQTLHSRLLDAVKACQTHLGGKTEMVTETSSWVSCLCTQLEAVLQHQLKQTSKKISAFKQVATRSFEDSTFWDFIKNHLTKHEIERFETLSNVTTDIGKGRAWIRCSLNEHSLDRYFQIFLGDRNLLRNYYENESFMLDEEKASTLSQMAAGLSSIFFNIKFDDASLNGPTKPPSSLLDSGLIPNLIGSSNLLITRDDKTRSESFLEAQFSENPKKRVGKKKRAKIINFGDDLDGDGPITPATKGGPGYVVIKQQLVNSNTSYTSESSSGVFSSDGNPSNNDLKSRLVLNEDLEKEDSEIADESSGNLDSSAPSENKLAEPEESKHMSLLSKLPLDLGEDTNLSVFVSEVRSENIFSSKTVETNQSPQKSLPTEQTESEDFGEVTRHLLSIRHRSALGSHDLVMDDWSIRSNSMSGGPFASDAIVGETHPMQDVNNDDSHSSGSQSHDALINDTTSSASLALTLVQNSTKNLKRNTETLEIPDTSDKDLMSEGELRQALMALMQRNDELTEVNRSTRTLLETEMEHSASLRIEIEKSRQFQKFQQDEMTNLQQQHIRENEVLRNQLKKYVSAVQSLQKGEQNVEMPTDLPRISSELSSSENDSEIYEKKLIEVTEMHGELMELNERLHVRLQSALSLLHSMKNELVDLRGPMPNDDLISRIESDNISGVIDDSPPSRALINIWIPSTFLKGKAANAHHLFQVFVRIGDEEWNVYRRYSQFHDLHLQLRKKYPVLDSYGFPPKKMMGNKGKKFVEDRRKGLQLYLRLLMNNVVQNHEKIVAKPTKKTLMGLLPFFSENLD